MAWTGSLEDKKDKLQWQQAVLIGVFIKKLF